MRMRTVIALFVSLTACDPELKRVDRENDGATAADAATDGALDGSHMPQPEGGADAHVSGPDAHVAVECSGDATCPISEPACVADGCSSCRDGADCTRFAPTAPACASSGACVECTESEASACTGSTKVCLAGGNKCVQCNVDLDCPNADKAKCDTTTNECVSCDADVQCAHVDDDRKVCGSEGACVECTPETEAANCGDKACDPDTLECTDTKRGSVATCGACRSDTECGSSRKCIRVPVNGDKGEYHCMQAVEAGDCAQPYRSNPLTVSSKNHAPVAEYCAHNTMLTTCAAILSLGRSCTVGTAEADCGPGGRCGARVNGASNACTYSCTADLECPTTALCNEQNAKEPVPYCGGPAI